jgi:hypothetical protein
MMIRYDAIKNLETLFWVMWKYIFLYNKDIITYSISLVEKYNISTDDLIGELEHLKIIHDANIWFPRWHNYNF